MSGVTVRLASNEVVNFMDSAGTEWTWEVSGNGELFVFQRKVADTRKVKLKPDNSNIAEAIDQEVHEQLVQPLRYAEYGYAPGVWASVVLE